MKLANSPLVWELIAVKDNPGDPPVPVLPRLSPLFRAEKCAEKAVSQNGSDQAKK